MPLCVFAYTPAMPEPPFVNVSRLENGEYRITVRSEVRDGTDYGPTASMTLTREHVTELYRSLLRDLMVTDAA